MYFLVNASYPPYPFNLETLQVLSSHNVEGPGNICVTLTLGSKVK